MEQRDIQTGLPIQKCGRIPSDAELVCNRYTTKVGLVMAVVIAVCFIACVVGISFIESKIEKLEKKADIAEKNITFLNNERISHLRILLAAQSRLNVCEQGAKRAMGTRRWDEATEAENERLKETVARMQKGQ